MSTTEHERRWAPISDAATEHGVHPRTIRRMISRGEVYAERLGPRLIRVDLNSIQGKPLQYLGGEA